MNPITPPVGGPIEKFTTQSGHPMIVSFEYEGKKYRVRVSMQVMGISRAEGNDPRGLPLFNVMAAPVMIVEEGS